MAPPTTIVASEEAGALVLRAAGDWLVTEAAGLDRRLRALKVPPGRPVVIDAAGIERLDTAGAWLLLRTERTLAGRGHAVTLTDLRPSLLPLFEQLRDRDVAPPPPHPSPAHYTSPAFSRASARSPIGIFGAATRSSDSAGSSW